MSLASFFNRIIAKYYIGDERLKPILDVQMPTVKIQLAEGLNELSYRRKSPTINNLNTIDIEVCNSCNLACTICPVNTGVMKRKKGFMDYSLFTRIIDTNPSLKRIRFSLWGEPLLHPKLFDFISYAREKTNAHLLFYTNAALLNKKNRQKIVNSGIDAICFSIDGNKETYEKIRGFSYDKVKENIIALKQDLLESQAKTKLHIQAVGTPEVIAHMDSFLEEWKKTGIDSVEVVSYTPYKDRKKRTNREPCRFLWRGYLAITWNGDVTVCCTDYDNVLSIGNVEDYNYNLKPFINTEKMQKLRQAHLKGIFPGPCHTCTEYASEKLAQRFNL